MADKGVEVVCLEDVLDSAVIYGQFLPFYVDYDRLDGALEFSLFRSLLGLNMVSVWLKLTI